MQGQVNPKIVGATIIGFALIAGAFTVSNMQQPKTVLQPATVSSAVPPRVAIAVSDSDNNGVEDWQDEFVTTKPVVLDQASTTYTPPETLTGQMSLTFMESVIRSKNYGPFGQSQDEVISNTINYLADETNVKIYDTPDISIIDNWEDQDILNYANTVVATIYKYGDTGLKGEGELYILHEIVTSGDPSRITDLQKLVSMYRNYRDDTLLIPVPAFLAKEHLDLINAYNAILEDITAMTLVFDDPAVSLLRLKRYQDDADGLAYSLRNMYQALEPYSYLVGPEDPALFFAIFSPDYQT